MAVANGRWNFIFLAEPHTASRAVRDALLKLDGSYKVGSHHIGMGAILNYRMLQHRKRSRYTTFCTVRNPADILATLWVLKPERERELETFAQYIRRWGVKKPDPFFFRHAKTADRVIRYENLQEELNFLLHEIGAPTVKLDTVGPTADKAPWFRYYTPPDLRYMITHFPEISQWGYVDVIRQQIDAKNRKLT